MDYKRFGTQLKEPGMVSYTLLLLLTLVVYLPSIYFPFFFLDDRFHILRNPNIGLSLENIIWFWKNSDIPIAYNFWQVIGFLGGVDNPGMFRFFNIMIHFFNGLLLFKISNKLLRKWTDVPRTVPFLVSFIFLIHPVQVESVVWISSFRSTLATFFMFLALDNYSKRSGIWSDFIVLVFYILGVFSKPIVGVLPIFLFTLDYFVEKKSFKKSFLSLYTIIPGIILIGFFFIKLLPKVILKTDLTLVERFLVLLDSLYFYFLKSFFPLFLSSIYGRSLNQVVSSFNSNSYVFELIGFVLFVLAAAFFSIRKKNNLILFGLVIFIVFYIPTSGLFSFYYQIISTVADRYMYIPIIGISLIGLQLWYSLKVKIRGMASEKLLNSISIMFFIVMIFTSCRQVSLWSDDLSILAPGGVDNPDSYHVQLALGIEYLERNQIRKAKYHLTNAHRLDREKIEPKIYLADALVRQGKTFQAQAQYFNNESKDSAYLSIAYTIADGMANSGEYKEAESIIRQSLNNFPYDDELKMRAVNLERGAIHRMIYSVKRILNSKDYELSRPARDFLIGYLERLKQDKTLNN